jgi:hypothetical protein
VRVKYFYRPTLDFFEEEAMHCHNVLFWLQDDLSYSELMEFEKGIKTIINDPHVIRGVYGKPANTHRSVVENSYSYGLSIMFKDLADHDLYQAEPIQLVFVEKKYIKMDQSLGI